MAHVGVCGQDGWFFPAQTGKARHKATWQASGARCGTGASDGAAESVPFVELRPERATVALDVLLRAAADALHPVPDLYYHLERFADAV